MTAFIFFITTIFFLKRLIPEGIRSGVLVFHYTVYLGIDDVRPWRWVFAYPAGMLGILILNTVCAFGLYRRDPTAANVLLGVSLALCIVWCVGTFFLLSINL